MARADLQRRAFPSSSPAPSAAPTHPTPTGRPICAMHWRLPPSPPARGLGVLVSFAGTVWQPLGLHKIATADLQGFAGHTIGSVSDATFTVDATKDGRFWPQPRRGRTPRGHRRGLSRQRRGGDGRLRGRGRRGLVVEALGAGNAGAAVIDGVRRHCRDGVAGRGVDAGARTGASAPDTGRAATMATPGRDGAAAASAAGPGSVDGRAGRRATRRDVFARLIRSTAVRQVRRRQSRLSTGLALTMSGSCLGQRVHRPGSGAAGLEPHRHDTVAGALDPPVPQVGVGDVVTDSPAGGVAVASVSVGGSWVSDTPRPPTSSSGNSDSWRTSDRPEKPTPTRRIGPTSIGSSSSRRAVAISVAASVVA